jgi:hypothetical protein
MPFQNDLVLDGTPSKLRLLGGTHDHWRMAVLVAHNHTVATYDLHSLGWDSFQQLCLAISREVLGQTVQTFLNSKDGGRDGAFAGKWTRKQLGMQLAGGFAASGAQGRDQA